MITYTLGISSSDAIELYPDEKYNHVMKQARLRDRTAAGRTFDFLSGQFRQTTIEVNYLPGSSAAIVNSWWQTQTKLLFFVTSDTTTAVHSCMIMGATQPLQQLNQPDENMFRGKILLEGY